jgi:DNA-binding NarL/FixJ family response regulator
VKQELEEWQINKYQDIYKNAWDEQNKLDRAMNSSLKIPQYASTGHFGKLGGAPKLIELSQKASSVNKMLIKGMSVTDIAEIFGTSHQSVTQMKNRYELPRE